MAPTLFSKFIPNILPPAVESELSEYAAQDQKLQRELIQNGFMRQVLFSFVTKYVQFVARKAPGSSFGIVVTTVVGGSLTHFSCWDWGETFTSIDFEAKLGLRILVLTKITGTKSLASAQVKK